jgi:Protein of unknown function (DUF2752)
VKARNLTLGLAGLVLASPITVRVQQVVADQPSLCPLLALTGIACPSCGGTRATLHLLAGDPLAAWQANPGASLFIVLAGLLAITGIITPWGLLGVANPSEPVAD